MLPQVTLGRDVETDQKIQIGDMERRNGLYILGRPGSGKTTLIKNRLFAKFEARSKSCRSKPLCAFAGCIHFVARTPSVGST
jgi:hypothetical protein